MTTSLQTADALQLVSSFFEKEWPQTTIENVMLSRVSGGLCNRLYLLKRHNTAIEEPEAILIRHFGLVDEDDNGGDSTASPTAAVLSFVDQALVYFEMGRRGWGPKIYGTFPGGRLEEYIDAHPLTPEESMDDSIRRDTARAYARLHSLQLPLRRDNFRRLVRELSDGVVTKKAEVAKFLIALNIPEATEFEAIFSQVDWVGELTWTVGLFEKYRCKATLTAWDTNFLNVLVRNKNRGSESDDDCRVILIDFETVNYAFRGLDIGGHFTERMYQWNGSDSKLTGYEVPSVDEQRSFCASYLQEMRKLGETMTEIDTVDHLMLESEIGRMHMLLYGVLMCLVVDDIEDDQHFLSALTHMTNMYLKLKVTFKAAH